MDKKKYRLKNFFPNSPAELIPPPKNFGKVPGVNLAIVISLLGGNILFSAAIRFVLFPDENLWPLLMLIIAFVVPAVLIYFFWGQRKEIWSQSKQYRYADVELKSFLYHRYHVNIVARKKSMFSPLIKSSGTYIHFRKRILFHSNIKLYGWEHIEEAARGNDPGDLSELVYLTIQDPDTGEAVEGHRYDGTPQRDTV